MIYLFRGTDTDKVRERAFAWVEAAREKEPNLAYARIAREDLSDATLEQAALSGGLFVKRLLVLLDEPFETETSAAALEAHLDELANSDNAIVVLAPKLAAIKGKKLIAKAKKEYVFDAKESRTSGRGFNSALVNALGAKKRDALWLEVIRALRAGDAPEMLHGTLHWKARDLMMKGSRVWKPEEARKLSVDLIKLLQESRRKGLDLGMELERWVLSVK